MKHWTWEETGDITPQQMADWLNELERLRSSSDSVKASTTAKESMSEAEANYLWILEYQILPNQYGLKRVALLKAIEVLKSASTTAESEKAANADLAFRIIQRVIAGVNLGVPRSEITRWVIKLLASETPVPAEQTEALAKRLKEQAAFHRPARLDHPMQPEYTWAEIAGICDLLDEAAAALAPPPSPAPTLRSCDTCVSWTANEGDPETGKCGSTTAQWHGAGVNTFGAWYCRDWASAPSPAPEERR